METTTPSIPLVTGERGGKPSLWCEHCGEAWTVDQTPDGPQGALDSGLDHLEGAHGLTGPLYG